MLFISKDDLSIEIVNNKLHIACVYSYQTTSDIIVRLRYKLLYSFKIIKNKCEIFFEDINYDASAITTANIETPTILHQVYQEVKKAVSVVNNQLFFYVYC